MFSPKRIATLRGVHASVRGSLKRGLCSGSTCYSRFIRPPHTAKRGLFLFSAPATDSCTDWPDPTRGLHIQGGDTHGSTGRFLHRARPYFSCSSCCFVATLGAIAWWSASRRRMAERDDRPRRRIRSGRMRCRPSATPRASARKPHSKRARRRTPPPPKPEQHARQRRDEIRGLEQALADKTRALADRLAASDRIEQDLRAREQQTLAEQKRPPRPRAAHAEQLVAERQRELQRVAGLTADEARELLLKQIEADARRDAANLVKRLEAEARETAAVARPADHRRRHPAQRRRARHRDHRVGRRSAERRHEGAHHRPRGTQHPRARDGHRRRADRRRHARRDHPLELRSVPPRSRAPGDRAADRRRPHPSGPHRGGGREGQGRDGGDRSARRAKPPPSSSASTTSIPKSCA